MFIKKIQQNIYKNNLSELEKKKKTPSIPIEIDSLESILSEISELIKILKKEVEDNNSTF